MCLLCRWWWFWSALTLPVQSLSFDLWNHYHWKSSNARNSPNCSLMNTMTFVKQEFVYLQLPLAFLWILHISWSLLSFGNTKTWKTREINGNVRQKTYWIVNFKWKQFTTFIIRPVIGRPYRVVLIRCQFLNLSSNVVTELLDERSVNSL